MNAEQQLQAIRERWIELEGAYPGRVHLDIAALLRMVEERDAIIHDLTLDGSALARRAVEEFAAELLGFIDQDVKWLEKDGYHIFSHYAAAISVVKEEIQYRCRSLPTPDPLPPDKARAEAERLRAKLRVIQAKVAEYQDHIENYGSGWPGVEAALNRLLELAKENTP